MIGTSYYLGLRYIPFSDYEWITGISPILPEIHDTDLISVETVFEIKDVIASTISEALTQENVGILLSGGIDSAILAYFLPKNSKAYVIDFVSETGIKESSQAKKYADHLDLDLKVVNIEWSDYVDYEYKLMCNKKAPLHPVEVALHKAVLTAEKDNITALLVGNGADSTFGGMDLLLAKDWKFHEFVDRYSFINPKDVLKDSIDVTHIFEPYRINDSINVLEFLKKVHGTGIIQAFENSLCGTHIKFIEPYELMQLKGDLDIQRIRQGDPKYLLTELFAQLYPDMAPPRKIPFARPMREWLSKYTESTNSVFKKDLNLSSFSGNQKYLIHCLDKFLKEVLHVS